MCAAHPKVRPFWLKQSTLYAIMIGLGLAAGFSGVPMLQAAGSFVAEIFIRIFKCISLPIIALSIIVTLSNYCSEDNMKHVWRRTVCYTLGTTMVAAAVSFVLYLLIQPTLIMPADKLGASAPTVQGGTGYLQHVMQLIPSSLLTPFLENQVMTVLLLGVVIGVAIRFIPDKEPRETVVHFFKGLHGLFMVITKWVIAVIPLGLFGFITTTVTQWHEHAAIAGIGQYLSVIILANVIQGLIVLPLWLKSKGISPYAAMRKMAPALSVAFFSKSSVGALPVTMDTIEKRWNVKPSLSRFLLPLCTSINMNGCAAFIFTTVIFLMQNNGVDVSMGTMLLWIVVSTVAAIGNAGIPMGCFFLSASLLASMNVPITLLGIILPFYSVIDMLETALNVWSDACVVKVVDSHVSQAEEEESSSSGTVATTA